jgi:hypothetical protein
VWASLSRFHLHSFGAPGRTRTLNSPGRNRVLYSIELRAHWPAEKDSNSQPPGSKPGALCPLSYRRVRPSPAPVSLVLVLTARNRTCDRPITKGVLCQLSYASCGGSCSCRHQRITTEVARGVKTLYSPRRICCNPRIMKSDRPRPPTSVRSSVRSEFSPWKRGVASSNLAAQTNRHHRQPSAFRCGGSSVVEPRVVTPMALGSIPSRHPQAHSRSRLSY